MSTYYCRNIVWQLAVALIVFCIVEANAQTPRNPEAVPPKLSGVKNDVASLPTYNKKMLAAPLLFTENRGQVTNSKGRLRPDILFTAHSAGASIYLTATGIHYQFNRTIFPEGYERDERNLKDPAKQAGLQRQIKTETHRFTVSLEGANTTPRIRKEQQNSYTENFYLAHCPDGITGVSTYERVVMEGVYPGIDWVVYSKGQHMEYDFVLHPGADPSLIKLKISDADAVDVTADGALLIKTSLGEVREAQPISFSGNVKVQSAFRKSPDGTFSFQLADWEKSRTLVIDPTVIWSTYFGGNDYEEGWACATDGSGNVYLAGLTHSTSGIATAGAHQTSYGGNGDAFLAKFSSNGSLQWSTYYGGSGYDNSQSCAADGSGNVYLAGLTNSTNGIATAGAHQTSYGGGPYDAFLAKFNAGGSLQWGTYYGGSGYDQALSGFPEGSGNIYLVGHTFSSNGIATAGAHQTTYGGGIGDAFLAKFSSGGSLQWGTYYGGTEFEGAISYATDGLGNVYLTGGTSSTNGIATAGAYQTTYAAGFEDAFLAKFSSSGSLQWGTYFGGSNYDEGRLCATDGLGNVYIVGYTYSTNGIATAGAHQTTLGGTIDGYLAKFNSGGSLQWGTYYGGSNNDYSWWCAPDGSGNVYIAGWTASTDGIATTGAYQTTHGGGLHDAFLASFSSSGGLQWGTYYGGGNDDMGRSCSIDGSGNVYLAGFTASTGGIATTEAYQTTYGGGTYDAFLAKFGSATPPSCTISSMPTSGTYTDGSSNHIYFGYGDGKTKLSVTPSGGNYTYSWTGPNLSCYDCADPTFTATAGGNFSFTATLSNENGYTATCSITICVLDIKVPGEKGKVYICHVPQGNPSNAQTLSVATSAVASHLNNHSGDKLGQCSQVCSGGARMTVGNSDVIGAEVKVYPNPNNGTFMIELPYPEVNAIIAVTDVVGKTIYNRVVKTGNRLTLQLGDVAKGMYFVEVTIADQHFRTKLIIQ